MATFSHFALFTLYTMHTIIQTRFFGVDPGSSDSPRKVSAMWAWS